MEVIKTHIEGPLIIEPRIFLDERGYFFESFSEKEFREKKKKKKFAWDKEGKSTYGVPSPHH